MGRIIRRILVGLLVARGAAGQRQDSAIGATVRFRPVAWRQYGSNENWMEGRVARVATDTMFVKICSGCREPIRVVTPLATFDVQRRFGVGSRRGNIGRGAISGASAGLVAAGFAMSKITESNGVGLTWLEAPAYAAVGGIVGAIVGGIVVPTRWERWPAR